MGREPEMFQTVRGLGLEVEIISPDLDTAPRTMARLSDPSTSHKAAASAAVRTGSHKALLLIAYGHTETGYTDEEAASVAELLHIGYWKRCSDLRNLGLIAPTGLERRVSSGMMAQVCAITVQGKRLRVSLKLERR